MKKHKNIKIIFTIVIILNIIIMPIKTYADAMVPGEELPKETSTSTGGFSIDGFVTDAQGFIKSGSQQASPISQDGIKSISNVIYNTLFAIGMVAAVAVGIFLGIKIMLGSIEEKAQYKELLIPYFVGCLAIFGAFGIWKLVVAILQNTF